MKLAIFKYQDRHKIFLALLSALAVFIAGCVATTTPNLALGTGGAVKLSEAYNIAKPSALSKLGPDADIFNGVTFALKEDGTSNMWLVSFCSPSQMKSIVAGIENGAVAVVSDVITLDPNEEEFCEPLKSNMKDSSEVMAVLPEAKSCIASGKQGLFIIFYNPKADNEEGLVWKVICEQKYWDVDIYTGRLVDSGEGAPSISLPSIR